MTKQILMVMTSHDALGDTGNKTGLWLEEFASPYYAFVDAGYSVALASPRGGEVPIDPNSLEEDALTDATKRFADDEQARTALASTIPLIDVRADEFDAVFYPGGHGPLYDLADNRDSITLIENMLKANKPVAAVCHAPIVLKDVMGEEGKAFIDGKEVTGFSNEEESAMELDKIVPYLVEDELRSRGGKFSSADQFEPHVCESGLLITGQNPASSKPAADALVSRLGS
ncbi:type 1 glutamine amidotransferase domain-containing protein [Alteromonas sp. ASW11-130]|uniref:type 1 glutamine amidotransferase domain-containing protein n=1 Tax=Alteromonas sp. ASW11-130 TaxID=3015775 RepID=UPI0022428ED6|nr:type 1 glutamine amidotransferase domain-containing protein [Alteromonas sp. ASW11-130]MCW8092629.1 type 1 glutamine amidotransferase domain-containing protein [Alteromonas sp. ASW11-130]